MGTQYYVACMDCKIIRDLDKHMGGCEFYPYDRESAIEYCEDVKDLSFRYGLLVSFLLEHSEHRCKFFNEHDHDLDEDEAWTLEGITLAHERINFWTVKDGEK